MHARRRGAIMGASNRNRGEEREDTMKRRDQDLPITHIALLAATVAATLTICACTGAGGGGLAGAATIRGTVVEFNGSGEAVMDLLVPNAHAAVGGVTVLVDGTDLATTTDDDGFFIISGVPPGLDIRLIFSRDDRDAVFTLDVPRDSEIDLRNIRVVDEVVQVDEIAVIVNEEEVDGDGTNLDLDGDGDPEEVTVIPAPEIHDGGGLSPVEPTPDDTAFDSVNDSDDSGSTAQEESPVESNGSVGKLSVR